MGHFAQFITELTIISCQAKVRYSKCGETWPFLLEGTRPAMETWQKWPIPGKNGKWSKDHIIQEKQQSRDCKALGSCIIIGWQILDTGLPLLYKIFLTVGTDCNNDPFTSHFAIVRSYVELSLAKMSDTKTRLGKKCSCVLKWENVSYHGRRRLCQQWWYL